MLLDVSSEARYCGLGCTETISLGAAADLLNPQNSWCTVLIEVQLFSTSKSHNFCILELLGKNKQDLLVVYIQDKLRGFQLN